MVSWWPLAGWPNWLSRLFMGWCAILLFGLHLVQHKFWVIRNLFGLIIGLIDLLCRLLTVNIYYEYLLWQQTAGLARANTTYWLAFVWQIPKWARNPKIFFKRKYIYLQHLKEYKVVNTINTLNGRLPYEWTPKINWLQITLLLWCIIRMEW